MKQCKRCNSESLTYVADYEHLEFSTGAYVKDPGWVCDDCQCFHCDDGSFEWFIEDRTNQSKVSYKQIIK